MPPALKKLVLRSSGLLCLWLLLSVPSSAQDVVDSLSSIYESTPGISLEEIQLLNRVADQYQSAYPTLCERFARKALERSLEMNLPTEAATSYLNLGGLFRTKGDLTKALEYGFSAFNIYEEKSDSMMLPVAANSIGSAYADIGKWKEAHEYYLLSLSLNRGNEVARGQTLNQIGKMYQYDDQYDSAEKYFEKALRIQLAVNDIRGLARTYGDLGVIYAVNRDVENARSYYMKSIGMKEELVDFFGLAYSWINMGNLYRNIGKYEEARKYYQTALAYTDSAEATAVKSAVYVRWARSEDRAGNNAYAQELRELAAEFNIKVLKERQESEIKQLEASYNLEKSERELLITNQNLELLEKDRQILITQVAFLVVALLLLGGLFFYQRDRSRKASEVQEAHNKLLTAELSHKTNELSSFTLNFIQKQDMMAELQEKIKSIKRSPRSAEVKTELNDLQKIVSRQSRNDKEWEDFRSYFDQVHSNFFTRLSTAFPDLSVSELRLAALIKLNLTIKETSSILGISPNSVKTARYRLRTKLNLQRDQKLTAFLMSFESD